MAHVSFHEISFHEGPDSQALQELAWLPAWSSQRVFPFCMDAQDRNLEYPVFLSGEPQEQLRGDKQKIHTCCSPELRCLPSTIDGLHLPSGQALARDLRRHKQPEPVVVLKHCYGSAELCSSHTC